MLFNIPVYFHPLIQDVTLKYVIQYSCLFSSTDPGHHIEVCYSIFLFIFIQDIALKIKELINNLKSLSSADQSGRPIIQLETLRERNMAQTTENFLFNLAAAEGMVQAS